MSLFDRCASCQLCCKSIDSFLRIHIFANEPELKRRLAMSGKDTTTIVITPGSTCVFLGPRGCTLGDIKPFHCQFYPLFLLAEDAIGIDPDCCCGGEYVSQLRDPSSDASRHLESMKKAIARLSDDEKGALREWSRYATNITLMRSS